MNLKLEWVFPGSIIYVRTVAFIHYIYVHSLCLYKCLMAPGTRTESKDDGAPNPTIKEIKLAVGRHRWHPAKVKPRHAEARQGTGR